MNQPILRSSPTRATTGRAGSSGIVGVAGPPLARQAFGNFAHSGTVPEPPPRSAVPIGHAERKFPNAYAEETSLEVENEVAKELFVSVGYQFVHALKLPL